MTLLVKSRKYSIRRLRELFKIFVFLPSVILQKVLLNGQWTPSIYGTTHSVTIGNLVSAQIITEKKGKIIKY